MGSLDTALDQVAKACRRAQKPAHLHDWMDFLQKRDDARFLGTQPDRLSAADFDYYGSEAGSFRPEPEIAWFLPRMCEIMASGVSLTPTFGWIESFGFLTLSRFPDAWPRDRANAMTSFCKALVADFVTRPERYAPSTAIEVPDLGTMLCAMTKSGVDPLVLLAGLDDCPPQTVHAAIGDWLANDSICRDPSDGRFDLSADVYWRQNPAQEVVSTWVRRHGFS